MSLYWAYLDTKNEAHASKILYHGMARIEGDIVREVVGGKVF